MERKPKNTETVDYHNKAIPNKDTEQNKDKNKKPKKNIKHIANVAHVAIGLSHAKTKSKKEKSKHKQDKDTPGVGESKSKQHVLRSKSKKSSGMDSDIDELQKCRARFKSTMLFPKFPSEMSERKAMFLQNSECLCYVAERPGMRDPLEVVSQYLRTKRNPAIEDAANNSEKAFKDRMGRELDILEEEGEHRRERLHSLEGMKEQLVRVCEEGQRDLDLLARPSLSSVVVNDAKVPKHKSRTIHRSKSRARSANSTDAKSKSKTRVKRSTLKSKSRKKNTNNIEN